MGQSRIHLIEKTPLCHGGRKGSPHGVRGHHSYQSPPSFMIPRRHGRMLFLVLRATFQIAS